MLDYRPEHWNHYQHVHSNNCYNYAINLRDGRFLQPGERSGQPFDSEAYTPATIRAAAKRDGLKPVPRSGKIPDGWHKVYFAIRPDVGWFGHDYHWYRLDSDGTWSHKMGGGEADNLDRFGEPISDPREHARHIGYTTHGGYLIAPDNW